MKNKKRESPKIKNFDIIVRFRYRNNRTREINWLKDKFDSIEINQDNGFEDGIFTLNIQATKTQPRLILPINYPGNSTTKIIKNILRKYKLR